MGAYATSTLLGAEVDAHADAARERAAARRSALEVMAVFIAAVFSRVNGRKVSAESPPCARP
jgi:hypothetical protein